MLVKENLNVLWAMNRATVHKFTPGVLAVIEGQMRTSDENKASQLMKMMKAAGYKVS